MEKILFVNSCVREESRAGLAGAVLECLDGDITQLDISEADIKSLLTDKSLTHRVELQTRAISAMRCLNMRISLPKVIQ